MRSLSTAAVIGTSVVLCSSASATVTNAVLDDFSGLVGLGFNRVDSFGAGAVSGVGLMPTAASPTQAPSFLWQNEAGFDASPYSGVCFRISGDLTGASLQFSLMGQDLNYLAIGEPINSRVADGWAYVSWASLEDNWGAFPAAEVPVVAVAIFVSGNSSSISIDDVMFAVPAPGAAALVGLAGLMARRRRV